MPLQATVGLGSGLGEGDREGAAEDGRALTVVVLSPLVAPAARESQDATANMARAQHSNLTTRARPGARFSRAGEEVTRSSGTPPRIAGSQPLMPAHAQSPPVWDPCFPAHGASPAVPWIPNDLPLEETLSQTAMLRDDVAQGNLRDLADRLLETMKVEYVDEGVLLLMEPPAPEHRAIVRMIVRALERAVYAGDTPVDWEVNSENFQWELADGTDRFYIPDLVVVHPGARTPVAEQAQIALVAEVTSPASADTVHNDRVVKPAQYAKAGVPLYLLVDQERASWTLHDLGAGRPGYKVLTAGEFGTDIELPGPFGFAIPTTGWPGATGT